jgi:N6-L-threonylcarbamoyladenine synthase
MNILSIETSCDETGLALVKATGGLKNPEFKVVKNLVSSQITIHRPFGGVVPNLAKREHLKNLPILYKKIIGKHTTKSKLPYEMITVTVGPGLEPALWTGVEFAKNLARETGIPLIGANHLEGHLYSFLLTIKNTLKPKKSGAKTISKTERQNEALFPAIALIVSGGHTILLRVESFSKWKRLGETRDDAAGEAFDKVARMLDLPYPGGPEVEKLAAEGNPDAIAFPRPMIHDKNYDFSFSGLKTAVLYYYRDNVDQSISKNAVFAKKEKAQLAIAKADIAASFQQAAVDVLIAKTIRAARDAGARSIILCGGVAANKFLRKHLQRESKKIGCRFFVPDFKYNLDNGAMIAAAGYMAYLRKKKYPLRANGNLEI